MILFFSIFFTLYAALNYYIFIRGWQALSAFPHLKIFYLIVFVIISLSYIAAKFLALHLPAFIYDFMLWIGSFWFAFMLYFFISIVILDVLRLANHFSNFFPLLIEKNYDNAKLYTFIVVIILSSILILAGFINSRNFKITTLNIELPKKQSSLNYLNAAVVSDIHLSPMDNEKFLSGIIDKVNNLNPDIILMPGDIVDDKAKILIDRNIGGSFLRLKSKYGTYVSTGNHEFISGINESIDYMKNFKLNVLQDSTIIIDGSFTLIGRDDISKSNFSKEKRKPLEDILKENDKSLPTILLDHTPVGLDEAENNGIDLQLSGHTHNGQLFPLNFITGLIYEISWGYLKKGKTQYYVSCGAGTWGPPVKLGSSAEILNLKIKFVD